MEWRYLWNSTKVLYDRNSTPILDVKLTFKFRTQRDPRNSSVNNVGIDTDVKGCECKFDIRSVNMLKYAPLLCADTDAQNKCKMIVS